MTGIDKLKEEELETLTQEDEELFDLETLILDGADAKIPVIIDFPTAEGVKKVGCMIKPLTAPEWNNAIKLSRKLRDSSAELEIVKLGLFDKKGEPFNYDLLVKMPNGVVQTIFNMISDVSGVKLGEEQLKILENILGF
ncbi:MAG: hypothetical protein IJ287_03065 [Methanobrevibacter sp.]|nr:hypothetical protein [Methanobrevibacter sp.]MBR1748859.1 hypothetical protein [Bacilli bacterium]